MVFIHRFLVTVLAASLLTSANLAWSAPAKVAKIKHTDNSQGSPLSGAALDAEIFYDILLGEMATNVGDQAAGFALILEAARRSKDEKIYQRAADIALQARAGDSALIAVQAWKEAWPRSREANRYLLQILIALNRVGETAAPLAQELAHDPQQTQTAVLLALPTMYRHVSDKALAASVVERALAQRLSAPASSADAWVAVGRMRLLADKKKSALMAAQYAQEAAPHNEGAALLALELLERGEIGALPVAQTYFDSQATPEQRLAYARVLLQLQRNSEAQQQLQRVIQEKPHVAQAWLLQGALQVQNEQLLEAEASLQRFLTLADLAKTQGAGDVSGLTQAYFLLAQIAEKRSNYVGAEGWLNRIQNPEDVFEAQVQRAGLLARQGQLEQARALIRAQSALTPSQERRKLQAEVQLLRDAQAYRQAYELQGRIVEQAPTDNELVYEQAMLAEKAGLLDVMEQLLRDIIARQPGFYQAHNALGYSLAERGIRLAEAKLLIEAALRHAPGDPFITDSLGWVEFRLGNHAAALHLLDSAFKARPDAEIAAHLGEVLWSVGNREEAEAVWKQGLLLKPTNETLQETLRRLGVKF
ncbi:MAG: tetratricopeptide repeat protein [Burkholderiaceae bacterium]|nr:tetratricopeptide repeat protein [Burkholderiaceae bacterium]